MPFDYTEIFAGLGDILSSEHNEGIVEAPACKVAFSRTSDAAAITTLHFVTSVDDVHNLCLKISSRRDPTRELCGIEHVFGLPDIVEHEGASPALSELLLDYRVETNASGRTQAALLSPLVANLLGTIPLSVTVLVEVFPYMASGAVRPSDIQVFVGLKDAQGAPVSRQVVGSACLLVGRLLEAFFQVELRGCEETEVLFPEKEVNAAREALEQMRVERHTMVAFGILKCLVEGDGETSGKDKDIVRLVQSTEVPMLVEVHTMAESNNTRIGVLPARISALVLQGLSSMVIDVGECVLSTGRSKGRHSKKEKGTMYVVITVDATIDTLQRATALLEDVAEFTPLEVEEDE